MLLTKAEHRWLARTLPGVAILTWSAVGLLFLWLLGHVPQAVLVLVFGAVIGFAVEPLASLFTRFMPRGLAVGLGYVVGLGVVVIAIGAFATMASAQMGSLVTELPRDFHRIQHLAQPFLLAILKPFGIRDADLNRLVDNLVGAVQGVGTSASTDLLGTLNQGFTLAGSAVLALILSVYFVFNAPTIGAWLREHAPASQKPRVIRLLGETVHVVRGYVLGSLAMATLVGGLVGGGMYMLGVRYALFLGALAFFMEFIPFAGVVISGAACVLVALGQGPLTTLLVMGYFAGVHVLEADVIGPRIMGRAVGIHPAVALIAFVVGTELFGLWGALFAAPVAGLVQVAVVAMWKGSRPSVQPAHATRAQEASVTPALDAP